ncbi:MAG: type II toxin-antitoxin system PemK/MazF family toxin [Eubacterium sp.]|nr:type II toxin-antitoxin system PemK/MazF family toxin [Eubacterium sp.]
MLNETREYFQIAEWLKDKVNYHKASKYHSVRKRQVLHGEIWYCDMGFNVGAEKNKQRPVLVVSNNKINRSEKVVVLCITDAKGKVNSRNLPAQDSWFLLYSSTSDENMMVTPGRTVPNGISTYSFLMKDSLIQCEEIKAVSKARLDYHRGCIGRLTNNDFTMIKQKMKRAYDLYLTDDALIV